MIRPKKNPIDSDNLISEIANGVAKYSIQKFGSVDLEAIAYANSITFSFGEYGSSFEGLLEWKNSKFHIYVNLSGNSGRDRFTFAHELGHFFIPSHNLALVNGLAPAHCSFTSFASEEIIERQADYFASILLMPELDVKRVYYQDRKFKFETITRISEKFSVSIQSALYRVFYMNLHPMMIVKSKYGQILGSPARNFDFFYKLQDNRKLPKDSFASKIYSEDAIDCKSHELWLLDWFDTDSHGKMYERSIWSGKKSEIITVLWTD